LWLNADKSEDEEEEEVVETDGAVGYRERLTLFPGSEWWNVWTLGAEDVLWSGLR
jgi:hypothetical protein